MSTDVTTPDTIVLIHGFWVTPRKEGWEEIADYALDWAVEHANAPATVSGTTTQ